MKKNIIGANGFSEHVWYIICMLFAYMMPACQTQNRPFKIYVLSLKFPPAFKVVVLKINFYVPSLNININPKFP